MRCHLHSATTATLSTAVPLALCNGFAGVSKPLARPCWRESKGIWMGDSDQPPRIVIHILEKAAHVTKGVDCARQRARRKFRSFCLTQSTFVHDLRVLVVALLVEKSGIGPQCFDMRRFDLPSSPRQPSSRRSFSLEIAVVLNHFSEKRCDQHSPVKYNLTPAEPAERKTRLSLGPT